MNHLYCYKMTWDTEFAPNPHYGVLTLATCKPTIRRCAKVGDWISGWAARIVHDSNRVAHPFKEGQYLIYLARISKIISFDDYWHNYKQKRPQIITREIAIRSANTCGTRRSSKILQFDAGDNIYEPKGNDVYKQHENGYHGAGDISHDLSGRNVLICDEFYYFGVNNAIEIEYDVFPYVVPRCKKIAFNDANRFINYVTDNYKQGII